ncbi:RNA 2',3'-cyclic phosphodiesterase [Barrientosiimonas marina]|uniref:RNA 2',3'-cyclic phosphodiesterase n=1 Tax=Lentibacillus kimchii TaxID=1542911 RepID=A0ABW2UVE9_9BACI
MNLPHYFIAVPLPDFIKEQVASWQVMLKEHLLYKQWTHPDDLHITLKFLGPVSPGQYQILSSMLESLQRTEAFTLKTRMLGTFGDPDKPRVLWTGVQKQDALLNLQQTVAHLTEQAGFQREKRTYTPHITLAKKWAGGARDLSKLNTCDMEGQTFNVNNVVIYRIYPEKSPKYHKTSAYHLTEEGT